MKRFLLLFIVLLLFFLPTQLPGADPAGEGGRGLPLTGCTAGDNFYSSNNNTFDNNEKGLGQATGKQQEQTAESLPEDTNFPPPPAKETEMNPGTTPSGQHVKKPAPTPETETNNNKECKAPPVQISEPEPDGCSPADTDTDKDAQFVLEVFRLTNDARKKARLPPLQLHRELCEVALIKAREMHDHGYFAHESPTYGSPDEMVNSFAIPHHGVGENIAGGYRTPEGVMDGWMQSAGHRANILKAEYKSIGIGFYRGANHYKFYWVQLFLLE
ncbi:MAG TPA: hypothetical protein GX699_08505 [Firmicutes bacterium]|nr:hypothetical protein [Bacillota bacterium]